MSMLYDHWDARNACPACGEKEVHQDRVDIGVGVIYGPAGCPCCGWSEAPEYDQRVPENRVPDSRGGYKDQYGGYHPAGSTMALAYRMAEEKD